MFNPEDQAKGVLTGDGVHLNPAGNVFVATQAARALRAGKAVFLEKPAEMSDLLEGFF